MGQAKTRGTFEQRRAAAVEREEKAKAERLAWQKEIQTEIRTAKERKRVSVGTVGHVDRRALLTALAMTCGVGIRSR